MNLFRIDFFLRLLLLGASVAAVVVLLTSKQTELVAGLDPSTGRVVQALRTAKFKHSPALIYLLSASAVGALYGLLTAAISAASISKPAPSARLIFHLAMFDALMLGVMASTAGASGAVAYIGLKGDKYVGWGKICHVYDKFCRHVGSSVSLALFASGTLVVLIILSSYSLYRRCR